MRSSLIRLIALLLTAILLLTGCAETDFDAYYERLSAALSGAPIVLYGDMEYVRPDMTELEQTLAAACETAAGDDLEAIIDSIYTFYDAYDWFYTCYSLADIRYSGDLTDIYWEQEYNYCVERSSAVDAMLEELYYTLAKSPCRETLESEEYFGAGFFDFYEGDNLWDETFTTLLEQEAELQNRYYALSAQALDYEYGTEAYYAACAKPMAQLLTELIALRQEIAAYWGYTDYSQFANDFYHYRDYTPEEITSYLSQIQQELVPLYREVNQSSVFDHAYEACSEAETLDYVRQASEAMGGTIRDAFQLMETAELYDISYGENKYNSSFEVYLTSYYEPFVFMNPALVRYDCLTLAHEFGHFCNDYASYGSYAGVDVLEIFSQGMEYLSLCYTEDAADLTRVKMADSLCIYVEQAAFAAFEQEMYQLSSEELTVENLYALYDEIALRYGFDSINYDCREFVDINHFYTNPMYIVSYVVSNDAALQLYQMEQTSPGSGLQLMEENLATQETYFLAFLETAGLESPFADGRIEEVRQTFESILR